MIQISRTVGRKFIAINNKKSLYSNTTSVKQYLPDGGHFIPYLSGEDTKCMLSITSQVTREVYTASLFELEQTERSTTYYFDFTEGMFPEKGTYTYEIIELVAAISVGDAGDWFTTDKGLFIMYNNDTFTEPYFNEDEQVIPTTKVYRP